MIGAAKSSQSTYSVTGACRSSTPASASWSASTAVTDLPIDPIAHSESGDAAPYVRATSVRSRSVSATATAGAIPVASTRAPYASSSRSSTTCRRYRRQ